MILMAMNKPQMLCLMFKNLIWKRTTTISKSYSSINFVAIKKRAITDQSQILAGLITHANDVMNAYKNHIEDFTKLYISPIAQCAIF